MPVCLAGGVLFLSFPIRGHISCCIGVYYPYLPPFLMHFDIFQCDLHPAVTNSWLWCSIHFSCLHEYIIQPTCCLLYLLPQVPFCQYHCRPYVLCMCVMSLPIHISTIVNEYPLWLLLLGSTVTPCVPSPHLTIGQLLYTLWKRQTDFYKYHCPYYTCSDGSHRPHIVYHHCLLV